MLWYCIADMTEVLLWVWICKQKQSGKVSRRDCGLSQDVELEWMGLFFEIAVDSCYRTSDQSRK